MKKYELTKETLMFTDTSLYRIKALIDFNGVISFLNRINA
jgi:hypothetical protein